MSTPIIKILLIENDQGDIRLIHKMFAEPSGFQFEIEEVNQLSTALERLSQTRFDLILLALILPDSYGLKPLLEIQAKHFDIPIVILISPTDEDLAVEALRAGAQDYLIKGAFESAQLKRSIRYALERHQLRLELKEQAQALLKHETQLYDLMKESADPIFVIDKVGIIQFVNSAGEALFGKKASELINHPFGYPIDVEKAQELTIVPYAESKREVVAELKMVEIKWQEQPAYLAGLRDITEHKQIQKELNQRAAQLSLINNIGGQIATVHQLDQLLLQAAQLVQETFIYHHVALFLIEKNVLHLRAVSGSYLNYFPPNHTQPIDKGINGWVASHGKKLVVNDVTQEPRYVSLIAEHTVTQAELCLPIKIADEVVGVLDIQSPQKDDFGANDIIAMEALTHQLAAAIYNARLHQQTQAEIEERIWTEKNLKYRDTILQAVSFSTTQFLKSLSWEDNIQEVLAHLGEATQVSRCYIIENHFAPNGDLLISQRYEWVALNITPQIDNPDLQNQSYEYLDAERWAVELGQGRNILGHYKDFPLKEQPLLIGQDIKSILLIPIFAGQTWWGLIGFDECLEEREWLSTEIEVLQTAAGALGGVIRRQQTEAELRQSEENFRQFISSISDHIYVTEITANAERINRYTSPNVTTLTGYPRQHFIDDWSFWPTHVIHPDDRAFAAEFAKRHLTGQENEVEYRLVKADGSIIWVRDNARIEYQGDSKFVYGVVNDITERKLAQTALETERASLAQRVEERTVELSTANAELARAARLKDEFLANMSHELRTPLNAVLGMSEVLRTQVYGHLNQEQLGALGHIEEGGRHLLELINDILDLSKIEAGKLELNFDTVIVSDLCQASLLFIKQMAQSKHIKVKQSFDDSVDLLQADQRRLKQILVNLLSNAVKFTPEDGQIGLDVEGDQSQNLVRFIVWDNGIGIAEKDMKKLFKPFMQIDSALSRKHEGTGLGLSLVWRLTEMHGGSVLVKSKPGEGSRFIISLPWQSDRADTITTIPAYQSDTPKPETNPQNQDLGLILLAEDNETNIITVKDYLQVKGYRFIVARNGLAALELAEQFQPDIILMDIQMPVLDGLAAIRGIRAHANPAIAAVPIIALTALAMPGDRERCLQAGANAYLSKPLILKTLHLEIQSQLGQAQITD